MFKHLFYFFIVLLFLRCANIQPPTGGPRDTQSPKLTKTTPENKSVNFSDKTIELYFDEPINAGSLKSEIIFSPTIETPFKIKYNKTTVTIAFEDPLPKGITYTVKFGKGIKDVTEGNTLNNSESLVFSTGNVLDSLSIKGFVNHIMHKDPISGVLVGLYKPQDTIDYTKVKPLYYSYSNEHGKFSIEHLPKDSFRLVAFNDENNNRLWDKKKEAIGFIDKNIIPTNDLIKLNLFNDQSFEAKILKKKIYDDRIIIEFNKGIIYKSTKPNTLIPIINENGKEITFFNTSENLNDSIYLHMKFTDSIGTAYSENIPFTFNPDFKHKSEPIIKLVSPKKGKINPGRATIVCKINEPKTINIENFYVIQDTLKRAPSDSIEYNVKYDSLLNTLTYQITHNAKERLQLVFTENFFSEGKSSDSIIHKIPMEVKQEKEYGIIAGKINTKENHFIIQLLSEKYDIVDQVEMSNKFNFSYIKPGKYIIRVLEDINKNNQWDNGSYAEKQQPEPVYFHDEEIFLKANWELLDVTIELSTEKK